MSAVLEIAERPSPRAVFVTAAPARFVAIDIGRGGALALFVGGELAEIVDMPALADGPAGRPTINAPLLARIIRRLAPSEAVVEHVSARFKPDRGHASRLAAKGNVKARVHEGVLGAR